MDIEKLQKENDELRRKLYIARLWMEREVKAQISLITKLKIKESWGNLSKTFQNLENIEEVITKKIIDFFWEIFLLNIPSVVIDNIVSAEISFYNYNGNSNFDGLGIVSSYHKALDAILEMFIVKWFRKFANKKWQTILRKNDTLEKSLNSVVNKWYILSVWRLYHVLSLIKNKEELFDYWKCFKDYLDKYSFLKYELLDDNFMDCFKKTMDTEILWRKRHVWKISYKETQEARKLLIWDFENENCLIFKLMKSQEIVG